MAGGCRHARLVQASAHRFCKFDLAVLQSIYQGQLCGLEGQEDTLRGCTCKQAAGQEGTGEVQSTGGSGASCHMHVRTRTNKCISMLGCGILIAQTLRCVHADKQISKHTQSVTAAKLQERLGHEPRRSNNSQVLCLQPADASFPNKL